jgi:hypothetical protein
MNKLPEGSGTGLYAGNAVSQQNLLDNSMTRGMNGQGSYNNQSQNSSSILQEHHMNSQQQPLYDR